MTIVERPLVAISLKDYENRKPELVKQLVSAAEDSGFFALTDHGITEEEITNMFAMSEKFFALDKSIKSKYFFEREKVPPHSFLEIDFVPLECRMGIQCTITSINRNLRHERINTNSI